MTQDPHSFVPFNFNGHRAIALHIEDNITLPEYGAMLVFHYQWAALRFGGCQKSVADRIADMIKTLPCS